MFEHFSLDDEFDAEIDLTPLVDTIFILLIFFFLTTTFVSPSMQVNLAKAASAAITDERKDQLEITVDRQGSIFHGGKLLTREDIPSLLKANPEKGINLFVAETAPFQSFLTVVDEARLLNRKDISITTRPADRE
ncbi:MAG: biopolymer transporter ExbD [Kiritimatiellaceae bacterium]|nr:biopolymer transporter ExbD [Kiritimatiellaceae bacterium]